MKPMDRQIVPDMQVGRLRNFNTPEIAAANAQQGYNQIADFLEQTLEVAKPIYEEWVNGEIKGELEQIAGQPDFFDKYRNKDEGTQAYVRSLRPQTQRIVNNSLAGAAVKEFGDSVTIESANNPVLLNPNSTDAERSAASSEIRARNQEKYLDAVPASALAPQLGNIELVNAGARSKAQELRVKALDEQRRSVIRTGWGSAFLESIDLGTAVDVQGAELDPKTQREQRQIFLSEQSAAWTNRLDEISGEFNPTDVARDYFLGLTQGVTRLIADGDYDGAQLLLTEAREVANGYKFETGGSLGSVSVGKEGQTVSQLINKQLINIDGKSDQKSAQFIRDNAKNLETALSPTATAGERAAARQRIILNGRGNPQAVFDALNLLNRTQTLTEQLTPEQEQKKLDLYFQVTDRSIPRDQRQQLIINSGLPIAAQSELARSMSQSTPDGPTSLTIRARNSLKPEVIDAVGRIERARDAAVLELGPNAVGAVPDTATLSNEIQLEAARATEARAIQELEQGKNVDQNRVLDIFKEEIAVAEKATTAKYELPQGDLGPRSIQEQAVNRAYQDLKYVSGQIRNGVAPKTLELFPPDFIDSLPQNERNYSDALRRFQQRFVNIRTEDGKSVFPNFSGMWQNIMGGGLATDPVAPPDTRPGGFIIPKALFGPEPGQETKDGEKGDQASLGQQLEGALGQLLNVVIPAAPANAQSMDGKKESDYTGMQTAEMLSAAMRRPGSVDLGPATPGLPQQGAAAVTARPVPTSINSPNHPYFVAIGLNEGTRTPDGGYTRAYYGHTDPGDGAANRGTISARAGSPQQADRQWASILSGRAIEARAFLRKAGLADNTVGFQRVMFNVLDLMVQVGQYSGANDDFLGKLPDMAAAGFSIESVAKARTDSYINPSTGRLEAAGFGNSYNRLFQDQRRRAGTFDYKKRL